MNKQEIIWTEKYRPTKLNDIVLLPRIKEMFINGVKANYIFKGPQGMGKTTLANILTKSGPHKYFDSKNRLGINDIHEKLYDFCTEYNPLDTRDKVIFFDEFMVSKDFQEAIRGFIESSSAKGVRWIITTNYPEDIIAPVRSRFREVDFYPENIEEINFLKENYFNKIKVLLKEEEKSLDENIIRKVIDRSFPDMRKATDMCESLISSKDLLLASGEDIYLLFDENIKKSDELWNRCLIFKGKELNVLRELGTPFINYILKKKKDKINLIPFIASQFKEHENLLKTSSDPFIILFSYISSINEKY